MKTTTLFLTLFLCVSTAFGSPQNIICGTQEGEIYFSGVISTDFSYVGFYYSADYGENIELRDSVNSLISTQFGVYLADADDTTIHNLFHNLTGIEHYLSQDGGFSWELINDEVTRVFCYASGVVPGEIYRESNISILNLERSENYGADYVLCLTLGFPDSLWIYSATLGFDPGEVYIWSYEGDLYYSSDYAEHFNFQGNLYLSASVYPHSELINGAEPGEFYVFHQDSKSIWRVYNYGADVDLIESFPHTSDWYASMAAGNNLGELYYLAIDEYGSPGGTMEIYHTMNYGQDWTMYNTS